MLSLLNDFLMEINSTTLMKFQCRSTGNSSDVHENRFNDCYKSKPKLKVTNNKPKQVANSSDRFCGVEVGKK